MSSLQSHFSKPLGDFIIGDDRRACSFGNIGGVGQVIRMAMRDENEICGDLLRIDCLGELIA